MRVPGGLFARLFRPVNGNTHFGHHHLDEVRNTWQRGCSHQKDIPMTEFFKSRDRFQQLSFMR